MTAVMILTRTLLILPLLTLLAFADTAYTDNNSNCTCYLVNSSSTQAYFTNHRFFDFRNFANGSPNLFVTQPPSVNASQNAGVESVWDPNILNSTAWNQDWDVQGWSANTSEDSTVRLQYSPANVYIGQDNDSSSTYLTLRTTRLPTFQSTGEIESLQKNLLYSSIRISARVLGSPGAVAGLFTFSSNTHESDIELLTRDPVDTIRYTNQPSVDKDGNAIPQASQEITGLADRENWHTHRLDWTQGKTQWWLDGIVMASSTYSVSSVPGYLVLNMWSDGGSWSGNMSFGGQAVLQIQWVEMLFNTSGSREGYAGEQKRDMMWEKRADKGCKTICKIDGVQTLGTPEVLQVSAASSLAPCGWALWLIPVVVVLLWTWDV